MAANFWGYRGSFSIKSKGVLEDMLHVMRCDDWLLSTISANCAS